MRSRKLLVLGIVLAMGSATVIWAQDRGRGGQGGGRGGGQGGGRISRLALLRIEAVQRELELIDDQIEAIRKLEEELRSQRRPGESEAGRERGGQRGQGGRERGGQRGQRGRNDRGDRDAQARPGVSDSELQRGEFFVVLLQQDRRGQRDSQDLSDEERRQQAAERTKIEIEKLSDILLPHQMDRLNEIYIQVLGVRALQEPDVAKQLGITARQSEQIQKVQSESSDQIRSQMQALSPSDDRDQLREKMLKLRKAADEKVLAVLSVVQKKKFEQMKGEPFQLPEDAMRGSGGNRRGGGGGQGGRDAGRGQGGEGRQDRPN